jgi:hypothetical protein
MRRSDDVHGRYPNGRVVTIGEGPMTVARPGRRIVPKIRCAGHWTNDREFEGHHAVLAEIVRKVVAWLADKRWLPGSPTRERGRDGTDNHAGAGPVALGRVNLLF